MRLVAGPDIQTISSILRGMFDAVRGWLRPDGRKPDVAKKFEVNDDAAGGTNEPRASGKTFDITGESFVAVGGVRPEGRFGISGSTRPKRCPRCRTEDSVTRGARDHWRCRTCDFSWRWVG